MAMIDVLLPSATAVTQLDETQLEKKLVVQDNENETATATEYWYQGALVHRSVDVVLKKPVTFGESAIGGFQ